MASPYDVFDRDTFALKRITSPTSGHFDTNDRWVGPTLVAPATIKGHLSFADRTNREHQEQPTQAGFTEKGGLRLFTETLLQEGDEITAEQEGGITYSYRVIGMVRAHRLMARMLGTPVRYEFEILEIPR